MVVALTTCAAPSEPGVEPTARTPASDAFAQPAAEPSAERLDAVLEGPLRAEDRAREIYRHPRETIGFFGLTPDMTVVEVLPGGGWYTRILAPYVGEDGALIGLDYSLLTRERMAGEAWSDEQRAFHLSFAEDFPAAARAAAPDGVNVVGGYLFDAVPEELLGTADAVLFIRALHNMRATSTMNGAIADAYALLKPGGVVGVVQHRANPTASAEYANGSRQYLHEAEVIAAFEAAGFVLEERSEINANPRDPANWPNGARTLPPTLTLGLLNRDDYTAIGESDRMTLRFRKPVGG
jgi:predicted methyltransferase